jgi:hypothetical protein
MAVLALLSGAAPAGESSALARLWRTSLPDGVRAAPLAADLGGKGRMSIIIASQCSGAVWQLGPEGMLTGKFRLPGELLGWASAANLDGEARAELIAADGRGTLRAWKANGRILWERQLDSGAKFNAPLVVDVLGDRHPEILVATMQGAVWCFDAAGRVVWKHEVAEGWWPSWGLLVAPVVAANVDGRGRPEVLVTSREGFVYCLSADGRRRWTARLRAWCKAAPVTADFDADGRLEVMVGDWRGHLHCLDAATGRERWMTDIVSEPMGHVMPMRTRGGLRAALISGEGRLGVAVGRNVKWIWGRADDDRMRAATPAAVVDFDGDGQDDAAFITASRHLVVVSADGTELARAGTGVTPEAPPLVADINGDGWLEAVVAGAGGEVECYSMPPGARAVPAGGVPAPRTVAGALAGRGRRLTSVSVKPLWWSELTASPALLISNRRMSARHIDYELTLEHPDGRRATTAGSTALLPRGMSAIAIPLIAVQAGSYALHCRLTEKDRSLSVSTSRRMRKPLVSRAPPSQAPSPSKKDLRGPARWRMPVVCGRGFWHVARYQPDEWKEYGLSEEPFIKQAIPRVWASPDVFRRDFAADSPVRRALLADAKPVMLMNEYFRPQKAVDRDLYGAFERDFGSRFVGFAVHEWAYGAVTGWRDKGQLPRTRAEAAGRLAQELRQLMGMTYGRLYAGEGYRLPYHLAFREGLPAAYAEVGENIPCTPLQVAVLRGAARQYGRPWGFYISAWYRNSVTTYDSPDPQSLESSGGIFSGPFAGHSVSLMERMLYLGYLSGATFVHHESDAFHTSIWVENYGQKGNYHISPFGAATRRWFDFTQRHPDRGVAYAPVALMIDGNHGWCPADDLVWRAFPKTRGERAMDEIARLFFPRGFSTAKEEGFLAHGPFGDTVDFISHDATEDALAAYSVVMLVGDVPVNKEVASRLNRYVRSGGTLVLDAGQRVSEFGDEVTGAWAGKNLGCAAGARRAADGAVLRTAVYQYRPVREGIGKVWWRTGDGEPLVVELHSGKGRIVLIAAPHMLDSRGRLLPILRDVAARLYDGLLPFQVRGDIEFTLARNARGWVVGLINSKGIVKRPTEPAEVSARGAAEAEISAPWRARTVEEWTADNELENLSAKATRVRLTVPPGEVRVVFLGRD